METFRHSNEAALSRVAVLLDSLVRNLEFVPSTALRLFDEDLLPLPLKELTAQSRTEEAWCCWLTRSELWFYTAELYRPRGALHSLNRIVLRTRNFTSEGTLLETACWARSQKWKPFRVPSTMNA